MNIDMQSPEIQKLRKENYAEYRYCIISRIVLNGTVISVIMEKIIH